jgi:hypothetical protein
MESAQIKLTHKGLEGLRNKCKNGETFRETLDLQYLGLDNKSNDTVILSDGYLKETFALYKSIKDEFISNPPPVNSIIQAETILHKGILFIFSGYTVLHKSSSFPVIGSPISFAEFENKGNNYDESASNRLVLNSQNSANGNSGAKNPSAVEQNTKFSDSDFTPIKLLSTNDST